MSQKYSWYPTESAPNLFPIRIVKADLILEDSSLVALPSGSDMANGWGSIGNTHIEGDDNKTLPVALQVLWFSYVENQFYEGSYTLPKDKLVKLFKEGFLDPLTKEPDTYDRIVVGFAPGGYVSVWSKGGQINTEVAFFKADPTEYDWEKFTRGSGKSREEYISTALNDALDSADMKIAMAPYSWKGKYEDSYRKTWSLSITSNLDPVVADALINYYDGSTEYHISKHTASRWNTHQTIPRRMVWSWKNKSGKLIGTEVITDEEEILDALEKLTREYPDTPLVLQTDVALNQYSVSLILKNQYSGIVLKKIKSRSFEWMK